MPPKELVRIKTTEQINWFTSKQQWVNLIRILLFKFLLLSKFTKTHRKTNAKWNVGLWIVLIICHLLHGFVRLLVVFFLAIVYQFANLLYLINTNTTTSHSTCAESFSARMRSWMLYRLRVNSSTLIVLASVSRKNSVSWATQCISSLRMGCKRTAFSNSRRGNRVGSKMNGANLRVNERKSWVSIEAKYKRCPYLQWIIWIIRFRPHGRSVHQCPIFCLLSHIIQCYFVDWERNTWVQIRHIFVLYSQSNQ